MCRLNPLCQSSASTTVAYRPCTALTHHILWLSSALSAKYAVLIHYATVVLGDKVRFLPNLPRDRMPELYRAADAFVLASLHQYYSETTITSAIMAMYH